MKNKLHYIWIPILVMTISLVGSFFTSTGMDGWYSSINLPSWTPDGSVIGAVWTIIFILTAISLIIFWNKANHKAKRFRWVGWAFIVNGVLNILWSFIFFNQHLIGWAVLDAFLLALSVAVLIFWLWPVSRWSASLLLPYLGWAAFATYLNYTIYLLN